MSGSDFSAGPHEIPVRAGEDEMGVQTHPAATSRADGTASLAPLSPAGGAGSGQAPPLKRPHRYRHWTGPRMAAFLRTLAATRSVAAAARSVGMSRQSAYRLRNRLPPGAPFVEAWDMAFAAPPGTLSAYRASPRDPVTFSELARWKDREFEGDGLSHSAGLV